MSVIRTPIKWNTANFAPETNPFPNQSAIPFTWNDVALLTEIIEAISGGHDYQNIFKDRNKKKQFITLICKVKGYDIYKEKKSINDIKITAQDVNLVLNETLGINIKIEL